MELHRRPHRSGELYRSECLRRPHSLILHRYGQPATGAAKYSAGFTGNTCSEDLVAVLEEMGVRTGVDIEQLFDAGRRAEEILGQRLRSNVIRSGPVIHGESSPDKEPGAAIRPATG